MPPPPPLLLHGHHTQPLHCSLTTRSFSPLLSLRRPGQAGGFSSQVGWEAFCGFRLQLSRMKLSSPLHSNLSCRTAALQPPPVASPGPLSRPLSSPPLLQAEPSQASPLSAASALSLSPAFLHFSSLLSSLVFSKIPAVYSLHCSSLLWPQKLCFSRAVLSLHR